ncbi:MAG: A/G-specific adenine glycosylase [Chloroflexia bacterium]
MTRTANEWGKEPALPASIYPTLRAKLKAWWKGQGRHYPWRSTRNPYAIFLAEIVLQKTQVAKAERAFRELFDAYPTVELLAQAHTEHLERIFAWLGLVKRARFLRQAAAAIVERHNGEIPSTLVELKRLPGVGDYTASAILAFAYEQPFPVVDTSTARALKRLLGFRSEKAPWEDPVAWRVAHDFLDERHPAQHNYALIDLAALICVPGKPRCEECPLAQWCAFVSQTRSDESAPDS